MARKAKRFSPWKFGILVIIQFTLLLIGIRLFFPRVWDNQFAAGAWPVVFVFLGTHLFNCFFEWFFHRYILHAIPIRWLGQFARDHRRHHQLTQIRLRQEGPGRIILNEYPIVREEQYEKSTFPAWALVAFWGLLTPVLVGLQICFPHVPFLVSGYGAITWSLACYEIFHHLEHLPFEWWQKRIQHPRFGGFWKKVYGFHHMHHANIKCNEAISGFFGLPCADWLLRTYFQPRNLLLHGRTATVDEFILPPPRRVVIWLDQWVRKHEAKLVRKSRQNASEKQDAKIGSTPE